MGRVLLTQAQIRARVRQLGRAVTRHYQGERPVFLGLMNGALFFLADLLRAVDLDSEVSCIRLASYADTASTGKVIGLDVLTKASVVGRHILIVDDILDTGLTLFALTEQLRKLGAADVRVCVLLKKKRARALPVRADWIGFTIADEFVVGYGLDFNGRYRGLKQVRILRESPKS